MQEPIQENTDMVPMSEEEWQDQRLVGAQLRQLWEQSGLAIEELAVKMGESYTAEVVTQYEEGSVPM